MEFIKIALENAGHLCPYFGKSLKWSMKVSKSLVIAAIVWLVVNRLSLLIDSNVSIHAPITCGLSNPKPLNHLQMASTGFLL